MTLYSLDGQIQLIKGVFDEMVVRMEAMGQSIHPSKVPASSPRCGFFEYGHDKVTPFDPEAVKLVGLDMLREAGVHLLLHTFVAGAAVAGAAGAAGVLPRRGTGRDTVNRS